MPDDLVKMRCPNCQAKVSGKTATFLKPIKCPKCNAVGQFKPVEADTGVHPEVTLEQEPVRSPAEWYYADGDAKKGPIPESEIKALAKQGVIQRVTLVWKEGLGGWMPAGKLKGLFPAEPPPLSPKGPPPLKPQGPPPLTTPVCPPRSSVKPPSSEPATGGTAPTTDDKTSGSNLFFWVAGLSIINCVSCLMSGNPIENPPWMFLFGLGITQIVDAIMVGVAQAIGAGGFVVRLFGFAIDIAICGMFFLAGVLGRKRHSGAVIAGMAVYAFDMLILLALGEWSFVVFHLAILAGLGKWLYDIRHPDSAGIP